MGLSISSMLSRYFYKDEIQEALADIGLEVTGTKNQLVKRLVREWEQHNRDPYDLLDFVYKETLLDICSDYGLEGKGTREKLKRMIVGSDLLGIQGADDGGDHGNLVTGVRRLRFHSSLIGSMIITSIFFFLLPSLGLTTFSLQIASIFIFFLSSWRGLAFLEGRIRR